jgi:hypothetical protein
MDVVVSLYNHQIRCEKAIGVFGVLDPLDTIVLPDADHRVKCVPFINGPHADGRNPMDELWFEILVEKKVFFRGQQSHDIWELPGPFYQLVVGVDDDPLLEEGDEFVFLPEVVKMPYFSPSEWIVDVLPTFGAVPFPQLFPDQLPLECRQWGQCAPNTPQ